MDSIELGGKFQGMQKRRREHILNTLKNKRDITVERRRHGMGRANDQYILSCD